MIYKVLICVMDEAYADFQDQQGKLKERKTLDYIDGLIPDFVGYYDDFIDLREMLSVSKRDQEIRISYLNERLADIRLHLDGLPNDQDVSLFLHFIGHGGHFITTDGAIDEIQHIHYGYLFPRLEEIFKGYMITINLLGTCYSYYALDYMAQGTLLCCTRITTDYLSPFQFTSLGFYVENDIDGFIQKCGNQGGYVKIEKPWSSL